MREIKTLMEKYNQKELLNKEELLEIALYQLNTLNPNTSQWNEWNKKSKELIIEILQESKEVTTNKGIRKVLFVGDNTVTLCKICNGTKVNFQARDDKCHCIRGFLYDNKLKIISEQEYKKG